MRPGNILYWFLSAENLYTFSFYLHKKEEAKRDREKKTTFYFDYLVHKQQ